jgi:hypothetical protein
MWVDEKETYLCVDIAVLYSSLTLLEDSPTNQHQKCGITDEVYIRDRGLECV